MSHFLEPVSWIYALVNILDCQFSNVANILVEIYINCDDTHQPEIANIEFLFLVV